MKRQVLKNQVALWELDGETRTFFENSHAQNGFKPERPHGKVPRPVPKPPNLRLDKTLFWCPYCASRVRFVKDRHLGIRRCPLCGISENDYHVKRENRSK